MKAGRFFEQRTGDASVITVPVYGDNYAYLIQKGDQAIAVDPSEAQPVLDLVEERRLLLSLVLNTHHHLDHAGGNGELKAATGCEVFGPDGRIQGATRTVGKGTERVLDAVRMDILPTPGHTRTHVAYYFPDQGVVFTGDALFAGGCGRVSEGSYDDMWASLCRLMQLPDETLVFCGHEYTVENMQFAAELEPKNRDVRSRLAEVTLLQRTGKPTVPTTIAVEKATNPFLRSGQEGLRKALGMDSRPAVDVFTEIRKRKDVYW